MKCPTFSSQLTLLTVELISKPSNLIRWCRSNQPAPLSLSFSLSLPRFGLDQQHKQVWERACKSGTSRVLTNPSPLIAADASMFALSAAFHNSWCLARGFHVCFSGWFAAYCVSINWNIFASFAEQRIVRPSWMCMPTALSHIAAKQPHLELPGTIWCWLNVFL